MLYFEGEKSTLRLIEVSSSYLTNLSNKLIRLNIASSLLTNLLMLFRIFEFALRDRIVLSQTTLEIF